MTEAELVATLAEHTDQPKVAVRGWLRALSEVVAMELRSAEQVSLPGLGKLKPTVRAAREGRNPKTGEAITIPAKPGVKFVAGKELRDFMVE